MKSYAASDVRNVSLISHGGHGTTSLGEAILFLTGATTRLGSVDAGTSTLDYELEELERKSSILAGIASTDYKGKRLSLIDVPGSADFVGDTTNALAVCDGIICVVSAPDGVEVRTEMLWNRANRRELPAAIFINKMDRERADFERCLEGVQRDLSPSVTPLTIPIGQEGSFRGVVDLLSNRALIYKLDGSGDFEQADVPDDMKERVSAMREQLVEEIAGSDEELMEKYFDEGDLGPNDLFKGLAKAIRQRLIFPAFAGSATLNIGVQPLLDLIARTFPGADEVPARTTVDGTDGREPKSDAPFSAYVFKTIADQFAGQLSVFRVVSGTLESDGTFLNSTQGERERYGAILAIQGKEQKPVDSASVGDIVAVAKLKGTHTGDTLCDEAHPLIFEQAQPPLAVATYSVKAKKKGEEEKIFSGLLRLREEDPSLRIEREPNTGETLLSGMGQVHIEVTLKKLLRKFKVEAELDLPTIPYRETVKGSADYVTYRHKKQTGGRGQFGECTIALSPLPRGGGFEFEDGIVGGSIPRQFIPAVEKGVHERMAVGVIAGFPVVDVKVRLFDGKFHAVDSSEMAFKIAGRMAFKKAFEDSKPILLEPIWVMTITVPDDHVGDIMGDISGRRGKVLGMEDQGKYTIVKAHVPLSEVQTYSSELRSMTSGRGTFQMAFDHYEEMPHELTQKVVAGYESHDEE